MGGRRTSKAFNASARDVLVNWNEYYIHNDFGLGVRCVECKKWRLSYQYQESKDVPSRWTCSMWKMSESEMGNCSIPSCLTEDDFAEEDYPPGTMVWAKQAGSPWWPAMIEDSPDSQKFFEAVEGGENEYHVNFFGEKPSRNWIKASNVKEYGMPPPAFRSHRKRFKPSRGLIKAIEQAEEASKLSLKERLAKYSFAVRYKGKWAKIKNKDDVSLPPTCPMTPTVSKIQLPPKHLTPASDSTSLAKPIVAKISLPPKCPKVNSSKKSTVAKISLPPTCPKVNSSKKFTVAKISLPPTCPKVNSSKKSTESELSVREDNQQQTSVPRKRKITYKFCETAEVKSEPEKDHLSVYQNEKEKNKRVKNEAQVEKELTDENNPQSAENPRITTRCSSVILRYLVPYDFFKDKKINSIPSTDSSLVIEEEAALDDAENNNDSEEDVALDDVENNNDSEEIRDSKDDDDDMAENLSDDEDVVIAPEGLAYAEYLDKVISSKFENPFTESETDE